LTEDGKCVKIEIDCKNGAVQVGDKCVAIKCDKGYTLKNDVCTKDIMVCKEPLVMNMKTKQCEKTKCTVPNTRWSDKQAKCVKISCEKGFTMTKDGACEKTTINCPKGESLEGDKCIKIYEECQDDKHANCTKCDKLYGTYKKVESFLMEAAADKNAGKLRPGAQVLADKLKAVMFHSSKSVA